MKKNFLVIVMVVGVILVGMYKAADALSDKVAISPRPKYVTFLKKHESEMTKYIKKDLPGRTKIIYRWETVESIQSMAFSAPELVIRFDIIDNSNPKCEKYLSENNELVIETNVKELDKIDSLYYQQSN